jgi:hypothetical protein
VCACRSTPCEKMHQWLRGRAGQEWCLTSRKQRTGVGMQNSRGLHQKTLSGADHNMGCSNMRHKSMGHRKDSQEAAYQAMP